MTGIDKALEQMLAAGLPSPPEGRLVADGRIHRFGKRARAWYVLHEYVARNGRRFVAGAFGIWGQLEATKIESAWEGIDHDEAERLKRSQAELEARQREKRERRAREAATRARHQWNGARAALRAGERCEYLERKGVQHESGLRFFTDGTLLVPAVRYDVTEELERDPEYKGPPRLVGLQKIAGDGTKRFNAGMSKAGAACRLGKKVRDGEAFVICEGVATALSIRQALERGVAVFVAFDAYNLEPVARILRSLYPRSPIVFCADDDHETEGNPGKSLAQRAATAAAGATAICVPEFSGERSAKATDFNDLHLAEGLDKVQQQVGAALAIARASSAQASAPASDDGGKKKDDPPDWDLHRQLLERFTQLYPSDEAWDSDIERIVKVEHMRLMFGKRPIGLWLGSKHKRVILRDNVVFDPTGKANSATHINLFRGLAVKPDGSRGCERLIELLYYLCNENDEVFNWVICWLAYQLQHVGAKMHTALVFFGDEGAGKNLFFGAFAQIFGDHAGVISQMQLQSQFNDWISAKQFLIANEVVTRQELRHHVGYLKNLITEPQIWVNSKNISGRWEANHANIVFFSNELQPLQIGPRDRRYMIIKTPPAREQAFYLEVVKEIESGGVAALHQYLLDVELGDFGVQTKPIDTQAKSELFELGMPAAQLFWRDIKEGAIPLPYVPALVADVYRAFQHYCPRIGEKMPERINRFVPNFMQLNGVKRAEERVPDPDLGAGMVADSSTYRRRRILLMGEPLADAEAEKARRIRGILDFRKALREYLRADDLTGGAAGGFFGGRGSGERY